ncbi:hypothetical protein FO519_007997 [Halicephalobus sp. NKZ332]|nr:hypothetical protein FO519_007997 [Halicephalobus sp. NKZ332]
MSNIGSINLTALEDAMEQELENQDFEYWFEHLSELELEGTESPEVLRAVFRGYKWILQYEHANAEELKEIAEKEAVETAEKEENWEQEKEILKEEISTLRERITSKAGFDDMHEAFRAEIDSLKSESNYLKQQLRDRDRELSDQRDKNEELSARFENIEKERTLLITNQSQLEDTIRELNRRITTKTDVSKSDWEAKKLKQRSEQAIILSNQLQNAVVENKNLQSEVKRLSTALEQATVLIKDTTEKYKSLREELVSSEKTVEKLLDDNQILKKQLLKKQNSFNEKTEVLETNMKDIDSLVKQKDSQLEKFRETIQKQQLELDDQKTRISLINNEEKEVELERLKQELVEATKIARELFGSMTTDPGGQSMDPTSELRVRIIQLDKQLEITEAKIKELEAENQKLENIVVEKDELNAKITRELDKIRKITFGEADEEIKNLEKQIKFREDQIKELATKCSLLQIELERYLGYPPEDLQGKKSETLRISKPQISSTSKNPERRSSSEAPKVPGRKSDFEIPEKISTSSKSTFKDIVRQKQGVKSPVLRRKIEESLFKKSPKNFDEEYMNSIEASAMIISSLNYELMKIMKENEEKERLLREMEKTVIDHSKDLQKSRIKINQLMKDYAKLKMEKMVSIDMGVFDEESQAKNQRLEELEIKVVELERLADTVRKEGPELHRRIEEASRKLIFVQIKNAEFERKAENSIKMENMMKEMTEKMRKKLKSVLIGENKRLKDLSKDYELNMIEIARLQNQLINSVPLIQYEKKRNILRRKAWKKERQNLFTVILGLQQAVQRLRAQTTSGINIDHLVKFKEATEDFRNRERNLKENEEKAKNELENISIQKSLVQAQGETMKDILENDFDLQRLQKTIQGYQFNVLALSNELKGAKIEVEKLGNELNSHEEEIAELRRENDNLLLSQIDISKLSAWKDEDEEEDDDEDIKKYQDEKEYIKKHREEDGTKKYEEKVKVEQSRRISKTYSTVEKSDSEESSSDFSRSSSSEVEKELERKTRTVIYDNSEEYRKQLEEVKKTAKICIQSYKEQLEQKESAIEEYKLLLMNLSRQLSQQPKVQANSRDERNEKEKLKTSSELLNDVRVEEKEREIHLLQGQLKDLEKINAELSSQLEKVKDISKKLEKTKKEEVIPLPPPKSNSFEDDFESESEDEREDVKTPVPEDFGDIPEENESMKAASSGEDSDSDEGGTTDSGTVEDIEERPRRISRSSSNASRASSEDKNEDKLTFDGKRKGTSESRSIVTGEDRRKLGTSGTRSILTTGDDRERTLTLNDRKRLDTSGTRSITTGDDKRGPEASGSRSAVVAGDDREHVIYTQRNEIRKLRERIAVLERKTRQLESERDAWKERNRFGAKKEFDPSSESAFLKKENERLKRESKNLTRTLENQKQKIDELQKSLTKRTVFLQNKESVENWEEKKKKESGIISLKKKLEESISRETELTEQLEKKNRFLEQFQNQQLQKSQDSEKIHQVMKMIKAEKENFEKKEVELKEESLMWKEKSREILMKLEMTMKENRGLKNRIQSLQSRLEEVELQLASRPESPPRKSDVQVQTSERSTSRFIPKSQVHQESPKIPQHPYSNYPSRIESNDETQTTSRFIPKSQVHQESPKILQYPSSNYLPQAESGDQIQTNSRFIPKFQAQESSKTIQYTSSNQLYQAELSTQIQKLKKEIRIHELKKTELEEELQGLRRSFEKLQEDYSRVLRLEKERIKSVRIASIEVLTDKLAAKDKEIEVQRHKIDELEKKLFRFENRGYC